MLYLLEVVILGDRLHVQRARAIVESEDLQLARTVGVKTVQEPCSMELLAIEVHQCLYALFDLAIHHVSLLEIKIITRLQLIYLELLMRNL